MKPFPTMVALFSRKAELRLGVSRSGAGPAHALVAVYKSGKNVVLSEGAGVPPLVRVFGPPAAYSDLENHPVSFTAAHIGKEDPEAWIDRNEEKLIPFGAPAGRTVHDYFVEGETLYSAVAVIGEGSPAVTQPVPGLPALSICAPLWSLAKLYSKEIAGPFILWRLSAGGSAFAYVESGAARRLAQCYIDCDDVANDSGESAACVEHILRSFDEHDTKPPVVFFTPEEAFSLPRNFFPGTYTIRQAPAIGGVRRRSHEAFANALFGGPAHNFLPFGETRSARRAARRYDSLRAVLRAAVALAAVTLLLFGTADGVLVALGRYYREDIAKVKIDGDAVLSAEKRRDALFRKVRETMKLSAGRSRCTGLLADLQTAFPEGAWAEAISVTEIDTATWQCEVQACTRSSGLIGPMLEGIGKAAGASNARMTYSEHVTLPDKSGAIRFKVKCEWR